MGGADRPASPRLLLQAASVSGEGAPEGQVRDHPILQRSPPSFQLRRALPGSVDRLPGLISLLRPAPWLITRPFPAISVRDTPPCLGRRRRINCEAQFVQFP